MHLLCRSLLIPGLTVLFRNMGLVSLRATEMPIYKGNIFLRQQDSGWSETYWITAADSAAALVKAVAIKNARRGILPVSSWVQGIRVSNIAIRGDSRLATDVTYPQAGAWGDVDTDVAIPNLAIEVIKVNTDLYRSFTYLHSIDEAQVTNGVFTPTTPFGVAYAVWTGAVRDNAVLYVRDKTNPTSFITVAIDNIVYRRVRSHKTGRPFGLPVGRRVA